MGSCKLFTGQHTGLGHETLLGSGHWWMRTLPQSPRGERPTMIIVFDAECLLCNGWVQFLLRHDRQGHIRFASIQGVKGSQLLAQAGLKAEVLDTLLVIEGNRSWRYSTAIFQVLHSLGWPWRLAWVAWLVPSPLRDAAYRLIARNRYRIFGRSTTCILPPADFATRFLD